MFVQRIEGASAVIVDAPGTGAAAACQALVNDVVLDLATPLADPSAAV